MLTKSPVLPYTEIIKKTVFKKRGQNLTSPVPMQTEMRIFMETLKKFFQGLTGNQLKLLALIAMTCDHVGYQLLPQYEFLRTIGRLAFPIFAYMIAEGAKYTKNRLRYFLQMFGCGLLCSIVYFVAMGSL